MGITGPVGIEEIHRPEAPGVLGDTHFSPGQQPLFRMDSLQLLPKLFVYGNDNKFSNQSMHIDAYMCEQESN